MLVHLRTYYIILKSAILTGKIPESLSSKSSRCNSGKVYIVYSSSSDRLVKQREQWLHLLYVPHSNPFVSTTIAKCKTIHFNTIKTEDTSHTEQVSRMVYPLTYHSTYVKVSLIWPPVEPVVLPIEFYTQTNTSSH